MLTVNRCRPSTVVVTGSVPGLTRNEGNEAVEKLGGKSSGSVSKRTDLVVVGDGAGSKVEKAEQLGILTLPADKFAALLDAYLTGDTETVTLSSLPASPLCTPRVGGTSA